VVDEAADVAHAVAVDDDAAIEVHAVMMSLVAVALGHAPTELRLAHDLADILRYELTYHIHTTDRRVLE